MLIVYYVNILFQCHINSPAGELQLSLSYDPWLGSLKVAIIKAKGLTCSICARKAHNSGIICVGKSRIFMI